MGVHIINSKICKPINVCMININVKKNGAAEADMHLPVHQPTALKCAYLCISQLHYGRCHSAVLFIEVCVRVLLTPGTSQTSPRVVVLSANTILQILLKWHLINKNVIVYMFVCMLCTCVSISVHLSACKVVNIPAHEEMHIFNFKNKHISTDSTFFYSSLKQ